jgi:2-polyprenyl-3-methyl-5-hydroxy-6-metoxy-1,4-benzoquinol methylase
VQELTQKYFDDSAIGLNERAYAAQNSMNATRLALTKSILKDLKPGKLLDAGCGGGFTSAEFFDLGWDVSAIDFSENMVAEAKKFFSSRNAEAINISAADVRDLKLFNNEEFDVVICLGVLYYIEDPSNAYEEFSRVLKKGGLLILSCQNQLFDLFTLNDYTLRFYQNNLDKQFSELPALQRRVLVKSYRNLLPRSINSRPKPRSARGKIFLRQDNPILLPSHLNKFGFVAESGPFYHGIHICPPSIMQDSGAEELSQTLTLAHTKDWQGLYNAAHFMYRFRKT